MMRLMITVLVCGLSPQLFAHSGNTASFLHFVSEWDHLLVIVSATAGSAYLLRLLSNKIVAKAIATDQHNYQRRRH